MMTPSEMKVFFHEFGHALHTILSRAEFQHLAGFSYLLCCTSTSSLQKCNSKLKPDYAQKVGEHRKAHVPRYNNIIFAERLSS